MLFDTHCHLNDEQFAEDVGDVIRDAKAHGVTNIVIPGVDVASSQRAIRIAEEHDGVYAAVGIHPESARDVTEAEIEQIQELALHPKVVAIGEIGLDYYWDTTPRHQQHEVLRRHIRLAAQTRLPIIIHNRDATADTVRILTEECPNAGVVGVMHCFTGSVETAKQCMEIGFYISYGGPVTFKNAVNVREVAAKIPADRLLIETDSPYLAPHPFRGKRNVPGHVKLVAEKLAEVRGETFEQLAQQTLRNALTLFTKVQG